MVFDRNFLYCQGAIGRTTISFSPNNRRQKLFLGTDVSLRTYISRYPTVVSMCKASSNKKNPDFSRKYRGSSKGKRQIQEKENSENVEDNLLSSKNGSSMVSLHNNQRFSATATPGRREKEIVELFRKVQLQLRERAGIKEEKRVESAQGGQGERGTVDSLLKLLRKHSVVQRKKNNNDDGYDLDHQPEKTNPFDESERSDLFEEEQNSSLFESDNLVTPGGVHGQKPPFPSSRPISRFKRKSPVPKVKFQPIISAEEKGSSSSAILNSQEMTVVASELKLATVDPQPHLPEPEHKPSVNIGSLDDAESETRFALPNSSDSNEIDPEMSESSIIQGLDLSSLKLSELRGLAKSRGIKGYTKLKKIVLLELLTSNNA